MTIGDLGGGSHARACGDSGSAFWPPVLGRGWRALGPGGVLLASPSDAPRGLAFCGGVRAGGDGQRQGRAVLDWGPGGRDDQRLTGGGGPSCPWAAWRVDGSPPAAFLPGSATRQARLQPVRVGRLCWRARWRAWCRAQRLGGPLRRCLSLLRGALHCFDFLHLFVQ